MKAAKQLADDFLNRHVLNTNGQEMEEFVRQVQTDARQDFLQDPTEEMWGGLARDIVMWLQMDGPHTGAKLYRHLRALEIDAPAWLLQEIPDRDAVPPKGTIAVCIYKAMIERVGA